jgi:hypothetical protein
VANEVKPRSKATYHHGTCHQCQGEGDVLTIIGGPFDLSLYGHGRDSGFYWEKSVLET